MSTYRLSVMVISRGGTSAGSALASAAYRHAEKLVERGREWVMGAVAVAAASYRSGSVLSADEGQSYDFTRKRGVVHSEIMLPEGAPVWMSDRERLWNAVESSDRRSNSRLARDTQLALPRELDREAQIELARGFIAEQMVARGMVVDLAIHDVKASDGGRQPHAHAMTTTRAVDPTKPLGFGAKIREWDDKSLVIEWRKAWADHVNRALEQAAVAERVDHRTLEAQRQDAVAAGDFAKAAELDREPEPKVGSSAWKLERDGIRTDRGDMLREVQELNAERRQVYEQVAEHGPEAQARFLELREQAGDAFEAFVAWGEEVLEAARAWARGAMVAAGIGAAVLGLAPERDSYVPEAPVATAPVTPPDGGTVVMEDAEMASVLDELAHEDRLAAVEAMAVEERARAEAAGMEFAYPPFVLAIEDVEDRLAAVEAEEAAIAREPQDREAQIGALEREALARAEADQERADMEWEGDQEAGRTDEWWNARYEEEAEREAAHQEAGTRDAVERELPEAEAWEIGVTAGDWRAPPTEEEIAAMEPDELDAILAEMDAERAAEMEHGLEMGD